MSAQRFLKVVTIGFLACALIAGAFIANESPPAHAESTTSPEITAPPAR